MRHISLFPWLVGITGALIHSGVLRLRLFRAEGPFPEGAALAPSPCSRTRLAGGQHQRLALAWVLLTGFPVVILDEPAEHLDEQTAGQHHLRGVLRACVDDDLRVEIRGDRPAEDLGALHGQVTEAADAGSPARRRIRCLGRSAGASR